MIKGKTKNTTTHSGILALALVFAFPFFLATCKPGTGCDEAVKKYRQVTADVYGKLPYTGTDTLYFLDQNMDTSIVVGQGKVAYYEESKEEYIPDCFNTLLSESFRIHFTPVKGKLSFEIYQRANEKNIAVKELLLPVNFFINYVNIGQPNILNKDSVTINGAVYRNVAVAAGTSINLHIRDESYTCYYNLPYGVLMMKSEKENIEYTLLRK
jgi:hypothetical protein